MPDQPLLSRPAQADGVTDEALEEINRLWTIVRAFSTTAHDVNNALQVIAGSAELLESRELEPLVKRRVEAIRAESGKAAQTIERLLSYVRAPHQVTDQLDLWPLVEGAAAMRLASLGRLRIALVMDRPAQAAVRVRGEAGRVQQAILNALLIAEDRLVGRVRGRIAVRVEGDDAEGRVIVETSADAGEAAAAAEEAGERLAEGLTRDAQGWATARILAAHGGQVTMTAEGVILRWPASA